MIQIASNILIVDDDLGIRQAVSLLLKSRGFEVSAAANYCESIVLLKKHHFDLAILDIMLGESKTGFDIFSEIRNMRLKTKVLFLTAVDADSDSRRQLKLADMSSYIQKPFKNEDLLEKLHSAIFESNINEVIHLGIEEAVVKCKPFKFNTRLGSNIAVTIYDKAHQIGGMMTINILKSETKFKKHLKNMIEEMVSYGCDSSALEFGLFGGSNLVGDKTLLGSKITKLAKQVFEKENIALKNHFVEYNSMIQVDFDTLDGSVNVADIAIN